MKEIVVNEKIVVKDPVTTSEVVALPGIKGDKGDALTYDDFTPEQIADLKRPATEAAAVANAAAQRAEAAAESVQEAVEDAEQASQSAQQAATAAVEAVANANTAVESVNALEERVEQAEATRVQSETQRQTAETNRASSEQRREANETERQQKFAQIESDATSLENSLNEAEAQRVSAENAREEAETQRETAENAREEAETQRETAENAREEAETQRETAEQNRETEFSEIKTEVGTLVTQTTEAKDAANSAATSATNSAGAANTAAQSANNAAELANQAAENVDGRVTSLEEKASQVYDNFAAIESSGETNPNKIYIDGETTQPYIYKSGKFVPFKGEESSKLQSFDKYIDLYPIIGKNCYGVYRFDDSGYYVLHQGGFTKLDLSFEKIYTVNSSVNFGYRNSGYDINLMCKIGNNLFFAVQQPNPLYIYNEETNEGRYLDNPENLSWYGSIYSCNEKVYYFHRYEKKHIYVYDKNGILLNSISYNYKYLKITEGIAFTYDGYIFNLDNLTFSEQTITRPEAVGGPGNIMWAFANGGYVISKDCGFGFTNKNNTNGYVFSNLINGESVPFLVLNSPNYVGAIVYTREGKFVFNFPYTITNLVGRKYSFDCPITSYAPILLVTNYKDDVYISFSNNILIIENKKKYGFS